MEAPSPDGLPQAASAAARAAGDTAGAPLLPAVADSPSSSSPAACEEAALSPGYAEAEAPGCPICLRFLCDPLTTACGHSFCRACLLQSTRLSPDGRSCPMCRATITMRSPVTEAADEALVAQVRACVGSAAYEARYVCEQQLVEEVVQAANTSLPIFAMSPGTRVGAPVLLHFFEPRYKILIRRAWEGSRLFVFCACRPCPGAQGVVVRVDHAQFVAGGRANVVGQALQNVTLGETWVEPGTGGLHYTKTGVIAIAEARESAQPETGASTAGTRSRQATGTCACAIM